MILFRKIHGKIFAGIQRKEEPRKLSKTVLFHLFLTKLFDGNIFEIIGNMPNFPD